MKREWMMRRDGQGHPHDRDGYCAFGDRCHPVVVISPEDREQVERLARIMDAAYRADEMDAREGYDTDVYQAALREFANPTPPRPEEPMGLGAVVEAIYDNHFVRVGSAGWVHVDDMGGNACEWDDIAVVRVLSEGVQP